MTKTNDAITVRLEVDKGNAATVIKQFGNDVSKSGKAAEKGMSGLGDEINQAMSSGRKDVARFEKAVTLAGVGAEASMADFGDEAEIATGKASAGAQKLGTSLNKISLTGLVGGLGGLAAAGAVLMSAAGHAEDYARAMAKARVTTGTTADEVARFGEISRDLWGQGIGDSISGVTDTVVLASKKFKTASDDALAFAAAAALGIQQAWGDDTGKVMNAAGTLVDKFGVSFEEAFDFITAGYQRGLDSSGDFLDSILEYSVQFDNAGADAGQFFSVLETGLQAGVLGTDKAADMFKEFCVRIVDGSKTTSDALAQIGIDAGSFLQQISDGKITVSEAFGIIKEKIANVDDVVVQSQAAVGLLGTQFEDLGNKAALGIDPARTKLDDLKGASESLGVQYDTIGQKIGAAFRRVRNSISQVITDTNNSSDAVDTLVGKIDDLARTVDANHDNIIGMFTGLTGAAIEAGNAVGRVVNNLGVNAAALALAKEGQISWYDYLTKSTNELGTMVDNWDKYVDNVKNLNFTYKEWQSEIDALTDKYELLGQQIKRGKDFNALTQEGEAHLKTQRAQIKKQIEALKDLLVFRKKLSSSTPGANHRNDFDWKAYNKMLGVQPDKSGADDTEGNDQFALSQKNLGANTKEAVTAIERQIAALQIQADTLDKTATEAELYRLELQGATPAQLALAESLYSSIDAAERQQQLDAEGTQLKASLRTESEQLADRTAYLNELFDAGAISVETYGRAIAEAQERIAGSSVDDALNSFFSDIDAESERLAGGDYWSNFAASMENNMMNMDQLVGNTLQGWTSQFGTFFSTAILESDSLGDAFSTLATGMATTMVSAIGQMIAQWLVYQAVRLATEKAGQASAATAMTANAQAFALQAGINSYASAAAIPEVGWLIAPAAMAEALAVTEPMAASVAALATAGMAGIAHDGIDEVPKTGTWLLEQGERVTTERTSKRLDQTLANVQAQLNDVGSASAKNASDSAESGGGNSSNVTVQTNPKIINVWDESMITDHINSGRADSVIVNRIKKNASTIKSFLS